MFGRAPRVLRHFTFCACKMTMATNWRLQHHLINWEINWKYFVFALKPEKVILIERKRALKLSGIKSYRWSARVLFFEEESKARNYSLQSQKHKRREVNVKIRFSSKCRSPASATAHLPIWLWMILKYVQAWNQNRFWNNRASCFCDKNLLESGFQDWPETYQGWYPYPAMSDTCPTILVNQKWTQMGSTREKRFRRWF